VNEAQENAGGIRRKYKKKTEAPSSVYHGPSSSSPPLEAPLAPIAPPQSHCREAGTPLTGGTKKQSKQTA